MQTLEALANRLDRDEPFSAEERAAAARTLRDAVADGVHSLRACALNTIAAELVWRASKPVGVRPWRPFYLTHDEALVLARHACHWALQEAQDRNEMVACDYHGVAFLQGAALLVLEKIEPGRWRVHVVVSGYSPDVSVSEREPVAP